MRGRREGGFVHEIGGSSVVVLEKEEVVGWDESAGKLLKEREGSAVKLYGGGEISIPESAARHVIFSLKSVRQGKAGQG